MEKRNVVLDDDDSKTASSSAVCPRCGSTLSEPQYCDYCGTEPFEKKPLGNGKQK